jgi:tetratricopeptide (TPR) repeat protein
MNSKRLLLGCAAAALAIAAWGIVTRDDPPSETSSLGTLVTTEPTDGVRSPAEAVGFWRKRAAASPGGFLDRTQLGLALAAQARDDGDLGLYEEAERELRTVVDANPDYLAGLLALGQAVHSQHQFSESLTLSQRVLDREPTSPGAVALAGDAHLELGNYGEAAEQYDRLVALERSAPAVARQSRLAYLVGDPARAVELAEEALAIASAPGAEPGGQAFYWFQLGHLQFNTGDVDAAIASLEQARALDPGSPAALEELAFVIASADKRTEAAELYEQLLATAAAPDLYGLYADLLRAWGEPSRADELVAVGEALARETIDRFPAERRHLAGFFMSVDPSTAVELAEADLRERRDVGAYDTLAWALYHQGRFDEAAEAAQYVIDSGIRDAAMLYHAGAIAAANDDRETARQLIGEALAINDRFHPIEAADAAALLDDLT